MLWKEIGTLRDVVHQTEKKTSCHYLFLCVQPVLLYVFVMCIWYRKRFYFTFVNSLFQNSCSLDVSHWCISILLKFTEISQ